MYNAGELRVCVCTHTAVAREESEKAAVVEEERRHDADMNRMSG